MQKYVIDEVATSCGTEFQIVDPATGYVYAIVFDNAIAKIVCDLANKKVN